MAISAIPPITSAATFIPPLTLLQQVETQNLFAQLAGASLTVDSSLNAATVAPAALTTPNSDSMQSLAQLEQALFNDWVASLQNTISPSPTPSLDLLLSGQLNLTSAASSGALQFPLGTTTGQAANVNTALISLFNTMQLLGTTANQLQSGSLLDLLA